MSVSLPAWLQPLEYLSRPFPRAALEEAMARREEARPHLLEAIDFAWQNPEAKNEAGELYMLHIFGMYVFAQYRETDAFPAIVRLVRAEAVEDLLGDMVAEGLPQILASVCGEDLGSLQALIEDRAVNEWVRAAAVRSLAVLLNGGARPREEISAYVGSLLAGKLERKPHQAWNAVVGMCADFSMAEHLDAIRELYQQGIADPYFDFLEDLEREIVKPCGTSERATWERYGFIEDTVAELEHWVCFEQPEPEREREPGLEPVAPAKRAVPRHFVPAGRPADLSKPKIGRNEICPCGSGKKYKKCCGRLKDEG